LRDVVLGLVTCIAAGAYAASAITSFSQHQYKLEMHMLQIARDDHVPNTDPRGLKIISPSTIAFGVS
jgi:hypothetical protein